MAKNNDKVLKTSKIFINFCYVHFLRKKKNQKFKKVVKSCSLDVIFGQNTLLTCIEKLQKNENK